MRIEVCGGIASGKTTLVTLLKDHGFNPVFENFQSNPFLKAFYSFPQKYAFETEVSFLLQHYHQIKVADYIPNNFICDYSLYLDIAYATVTLTPSQLRTFTTVYQEIKTEISIPKLLIKLECSADIELERIHNRKRLFEQNIEVKFLRNLNQAIDNSLNNSVEKIHILNINSEEFNFAHNEKHKQYIVNLTKKALLLP